MGPIIVMYTLFVIIIMINILRHGEMFEVKWYNGFIFVGLLSLLLWWAGFWKI